MFKTLLLFKADKPDSDLSKRVFLRCPIGPIIHKWVGSKVAVVRCACALITNFPIISRIYLARKE